MGLRSGELAVPEQLSDNRRTVLPRCAGGKLWPAFQPILAPSSHLPSANRAPYGGSPFILVHSSLTLPWWRRRWREERLTLSTFCRDIGAIRVHFSRLHANRLLHRPRHACHP